jgi:hypothetical protein
VYTGASWSDTTVATQLAVGTYGAVNAVSCPSSSFCAVGGFYTDSANNSQGFLSTYNGATWSDNEVGVGLNAGGNANVSSVSCAESGVCVAGGWYTDSSNHLQALATEYDGLSRTDVTLGTSLDTGGSGLVAAVSCVTATACVTGGSYQDSSAHGHAFVSVSTAAPLLSSAVVSGTLLVGQTLTVTPYDNDATPTPSTTYQWYANGVALLGATGPSYTLTDSNYGQSISVSVTETNRLGSSSVTSALSIPVLGLSPTASSATVTGRPVVGHTLSAVVGAVGGVPAPTASFQWTLNGSVVPGATRSTLKLSHSDIGKVAAVRVTEVNPVGQVVMVSPPTRAVAPRYFPLLVPTALLFSSGTSSVHLDRSRKASLVMFLESVVGASRQRLYVVQHLVVSGNATARVTAKKLASERVRALRLVVLALAKSLHLSFSVSTKVDAHAPRGIESSALLWRSVELTD